MPASPRSWASAHESCVVPLSTRIASGFPITEPLSQMLQVVGTGAEAQPQGSTAPAWTLVQVSGEISPALPAASASSQVSIKPLIMRIPVGFSSCKPEQISQTGSGSSKQPHTLSASAWTSTQELKEMIPALPAACASSQVSIAPLIMMIALGL
jgi:hypothetical protein